ncbi:uncharacterized protein DMAD_04965 [Drosophila madeirensis]|uniref:Uncharacterized protein n=1 Tax=Drosophila madeirensis TaxID=30013 RepID=A0AAU9GFE2_DROMD
MRSCILVALCALLIQLASAHMAVPCQGTPYYDCYHYCRGSCHGRECFHRCNSGCGCQEAFIVRNNGACRKLEVCQVGDDDEHYPDEQKHMIPSDLDSLPPGKVGGGSPQYPPAGPHLGSKLPPGFENSQNGQKHRIKPSDLDSLPPGKVGGGSPQFPPAGPELGRQLPPGFEDSYDSYADTGEESTGVRENDDAAYSSLSDEYSS